MEPTEPIDLLNVAFEQLQSKEQSKSEKRATDNAELRYLINEINVAHINPKRIIGIQNPITENSVS